MYVTKEQIFFALYVNFFCFSHLRGVHFYTDYKKTHAFQEEEEKCLLNFALRLIIIEVASKNLILVVTKLLRDF